MCEAVPFCHISRHFQRLRLYTVDGRIAVLENIWKQDLGQITGEFARRNRTKPLKTSAE
jgi:hypothetical protein